MVSFFEESDVQVERLKVLIWLKGRWWTHICSSGGAAQINRSHRIQIQPTGEGGGAGVQRPCIRAQNTPPTPPPPS